MNMEPSPHDILQLRTKFVQKVSEENRDFHPKDLARASNDDKWIARFLIHNDMDIKESLNMMIETCEWRKNSKANDINENNINKDYINVGACFVHNHDKDNRSLFTFILRKHVKGQKDLDELKKIVIYWMERVERQDKGEPVTVFFDMQDTGLSNMDMDYIKYIINLFKLYYPNSYNYILIFEMPWVLNAAFKIIKTWLPAKAVQKIKFVDKKTLREYVDSSQALKSWGGEDNYEFQFVSEGNCEGKSEENKKKVHFADGHFAEPLPGIMSDVNHEEPTQNSRLSLNPMDAICFNQEWTELSGTLSISNISDIPVIYKVKTTSPDKFRVRPSLGLLPPGGNASISVVLLSGYTGASILRDKFLVMCCPIEHGNHSNADPNDLWKSYSSDSKKVEEYKLRCRVPSIQPSSPNGTAGAPLLPPGSPASDIEQKMSQLLIAMNHVTEVNDKIHSSIQFTQSLLVVFIILSIAFGIAILLNLQGTEEGHCHSLSGSSILEPPIDLNQ